MQSIIRFEDVCKSFGGVRVPEKLSLQVGNGEKLALIGPSGSGKTTILPILMTLETIGDGLVSVNGDYLSWALTETDPLSATKSDPLDAQDFVL